MLEPLGVRAAVLLLLVAVGLVLDAAEEPAFQRRLIDDDAVLLVLAGVAHDGHDGVDARRGVRRAPTSASMRVVTKGRCGVTITCAIVSMRYGWLSAGTPGPASSSPTGRCCAATD